MTSQTADLVLHFQLENHELPLDILIEGLNTFKALSSEVGRTIAPERQLILNAKPPVKGSFEISLVIAFAGFLANNLPALQQVKDLTSIIKDLLLLKQTLGARQVPVPTIINGDSTKIENLTVNINAVNIYRDNVDVPDAIGRLFSSLLVDNKVEGFALKNDLGEPIFEANRAAFERMAQKTEVQKNEEQIHVAENAVLNLFKPVLAASNKRYKWEFVHNGQNIFAEVSDAKFLLQMNEGVKFGKGDQFIADLEITKRFDKALNGFRIASYRVIAVKEHKPRARQQTFDF